MTCLKVTFSNLGTDLIDAPSSLINHPQELLDVGLVGAAIAAPFVLPELGAAFGAADLGLGAADLGLGADAAAGFATDASLGLAGADVADAAAAGGDALALSADATAPEVSTFSDLINSGSSMSDTVTTPSSVTAADDAMLPANSTVSDIGGSEGSGLPSYPSGSAASGGGGITQTLKDTMSSPWTKLALGAAPLAMTLGMGQPKLPGQLNAALANAQALASGGSNLNAAQNASLSQMRQNAINAARQALFNQGVQNPDADTRWSQMVANIDQQVTAAAQTMIQQNIQNSLAGDAQLIQIAQLQMNADTAFANQLLAATKALGTAAGLGGGTTIRIGS